MATMGKVACTNQLRFGIDHSWKVFHQTQPWKEILALSAVLSTYWTVRHRAAQLIIEATRKTCLALNLLLSLWGSRWGEWRLGQGAKRSEYYTELWREDKGPPWPHPCSQEWPVSWILVDNVTWHRMLCCFSSILLTHGKPERGQGEVGDTGQLKNANLMGQTNKTCHHQLGIHKTRSALTEVQSWISLLLMRCTTGMYSINQEILLLGFRAPIPFAPEYGYSVSAAWAELLRVYVIA